jgi:peptidyl-prolyl cis-trans isomerase C
VSKKSVILSLLFFVITAQAEDPVDESEILAQRGDGVVTQATFAARAEKIPEKDRRTTLRDSKRVRDLINTILLQSQLASDAREAGFDKEQVVMERMQLAAEVELAEAWMTHYVASQPPADYEVLAQEYYLLHQNEIMTSAKVNVSHILISTDKRSDEEALELADSVSQQLKMDPKSFDELVLTYSEDPSAQSNKGKFTNVKRGDMVRAFEETAFELEEGEISEPVRTQYGYHIIRLDAKVAPEQLSFDDVKWRLIERERKKHEDRIMENYIRELSSLEVNMTQAALEKMVREQFGEDYIDPQVDAQKLE